uniref:glycosyltransferase family 2 protein n=1 Tax=Gelidibacter sp. TaxID=2018083 RepID=UPI00404A4009
MFTDTFFSIIIPTYNSEATIIGAIDSVLNQTFYNFEIIVIDGNSSDRTVALLEDYLLYNRNIYIFSETDKGIYDAMNKGVVKSKGTWLYFLGSDDYLVDKEVLTKVFNFITNTTLEVVYGNVYFAGRNCLYDGEFNYQKLTQKNICHQSIFVKRTVFEKIGNFDLSFKSVADWHHNIRWFYNNEIKNRYIDLTIAEYSDGGYSSIHRDVKFLSVKNELFFKYGCNKLPLDTLVVITTKIVKKYLKSKNYFKCLIYGLVLFYFKLKRVILSFTAK